MTIDSAGAASSSRAAWTWRLERADGSVLDGSVLGAVAAGPAEGFPAQSDAETWIGEQWADLLASGADAVTLFEGDREIYGPMSLHPED